jgi:hypothetical protein
MSTRRAKQLIYGTLYVLIVLVVFVGIYLSFVLPFNTASTPVSCAPDACAPTSTAPIVAGAVSTFITSPGHYTFLAQATNQDADYGAQILNYTIDLDDASGTVLQSIPGQSYIYPAQNKYLAVLNQSVPQPFDHAVLVITGASWLTSSTIGAIPAIAPGQFAFQNIQASTASTTVSVGGQLVNSSLATFGQVLIMVIFKDVNGNFVGVSQTELSNVAAGTTNNFSVIYPNEPNINPALNQMIIYALR